MNRVANREECYGNLTPVRRVDFNGPFTEANYEIVSGSTFSGREPTNFPKNVG